MVDVVIVGCGAVGSVVSLALSLGGLSVAVVARSRGGDKVYVEGLGETHVPVLVWSEAASISPRIVVYATKAYDLLGAVESSLRAGWGPSAVVSLQNGLGSLELLESRFPGRALGAVVTFGATRLGPCRARLAGRGEVLLGWRRDVVSDAREACGLLSEALRRGGISAHCVGDELEPWRWLKLAVNSAINPVTVLAWSRNRVVVEDPFARELAEALAAETGRVAEAKGIRLPRDPVEEALRVARLTGDNCSSMVQDIAMGRRTEIDYICKAVADEAWRRGLSAPHNWFAYRAVRLLEKWLAGKKSPCET
ncbi:ketopantoate reductase family protein [Pyrofollis japonicus]|uniref:ketopantoate reductase family protein n=1 Tax=Pyrofollis japonicus TaxID=3060460 RepID=UPI00295BBA2B|nr:ketopantoate reductase family protein [Pyrofollis japonicus]BEP17218.1 ketopantoate reductase family protein [Pyrofollis japonicus]